MIPAGVSDLGVVCCVSRTCQDSPLREGGNGTASQARQIETPRAGLTAPAPLLGTGAVPFQPTSTVSFGSNESPLFWNSSPLS